LGPRAGSHSHAAAADNALRTKLNDARLAPCDDAMYDLGRERETRLEATGSMVSLSARLQGLALLPAGLSALAPSSMPTLIV
jgi:hypothetical protein